MTIWTQHLTLWQRIRRRIALMGGSYTHPDGKIELDFEEPAGIGPDDSEDEGRRKLIEHEQRRATMERRNSRVGGIALLAIGAYLLASHLDLSFWDTAGIVACFGLGALMLAYR
jgi:hypothetical protein